MAVKKRVSVSPGGSTRRSESIHKSIGDEQSRYFRLWNLNGRVPRLDYFLVGVMSKANEIQHLVSDRELRKKVIAQPNSLLPDRLS
jgi:hypothetical protein